MTWPEYVDVVGSHGFCDGIFFYLLFSRSSTYTTPACTRRKDHRFLESLIDTHELVVLNDGQATRPTQHAGEDRHSVIDLNLATAQVTGQIQGWSILEPYCDTGSDHEIIEWEWNGLEEAVQVDEDWKIKGWALREALDKENEKAKEKGRRKRL